MNFTDTLHYKYRLSPEDVEITDTRGVWRVKGGCPGGEDCRHAFRGELGPCKGGGELTVYYAEHQKRDRAGRFVRPYREWEAQKQKDHQ